MLILLIILTGLMAGIYLAFSAVIMKSLNELPALHAAQAMNKINDVIVNTIFLPIFFGSTLWHAGLIVWSFADWQNGTSGLIISSALIYIVGMFLVTAFGNVPMNNKLKASESNEALLVDYWKKYHHSWTRLNHIRTLSCIASCALLIASLI
jgi:uncharacterized membrane protein